LGEVGIGHITARQELREMIAGLGIPGVDEEKQAKVA
jgi:chromosome partitioning protein